LEQKFNKKISNNVGSNFSSNKKDEIKRELSAAKQDQNDFVENQLKIKQVRDDSVEKQVRTPDDIGSPNPRYKKPDNNKVYPKSQKEIYREFAKRPKLVLRPSSISQRVTPNTHALYERSKSKPTNEKECIICKRSLSDQRRKPKKNNKLETRTKSLENLLH